MPWLKAVKRSRRSASKPLRPAQRLLPAGSRLYRTTQLPHVFYWSDHPEGGPTTPARPKAAAPGAARPAPPARRRAPARRDVEPLAVDAPAEQFNAWLDTLYHPR